LDYHQAPDHNNTHQPEPGRQRGDNPPAVQKTNWRKVEEIQKESGISQCAEEGVSRHSEESVTEHRAHRAQQRAANANLGLNPGIARSLLERNNSAHEWNKHGCPDPQAKALGRDQMAAFVDKYQKNEPNRELPTPGHRVKADGQQHCPARLENKRKKLEGR